MAYGVCMVCVVGIVWCVHVHGMRYAACMMGCVHDVRCAWHVMCMVLQLAWCDACMACDMHGMRRAACMACGVRRAWQVVCMMCSMHGIWRVVCNVRCVWRAVCGVQRVFREQLSDS